jgi:Glyoxalase-like domain
MTVKHNKHNIWPVCSSGAQAPAAVLRIKGIEGCHVARPGCGVPEFFQLAPEGKSVKNRWHIDVRVGEDDLDGVVAKLTERGATFPRTGQQGPYTWVILADPEGKEFCVSR